MLYLKSSELATTKYYKELAEVIIMANNASNINKQLKEIESLESELDSLDSELAELLGSITVKSESAGRQRESQHSERNKQGLATLVKQHSTNTQGYCYKLYFKNNLKPQFIRLVAQQAKDASFITRCESDCKEPQIHWTTGLLLERLFSDNTKASKINLYLDIPSDLRASSDYMAKHLNG